MILFIICIGSCVLLPGNAAQLSSDRIGWSAMVFASLSVIILVKIFLPASSNVMGLVMLRLFSQSLGFGIGYIMPRLHSLGVIPSVRIELYILVSCSMADVFKCL